MRDTMGFVNADTMAIILPARLSCHAPPRQGGGRPARRSLAPFFRSGHGKSVLSGI